ncbi:hypothetical protein JHE00_18470 [Prauserella sp. ASG 168]|uniref:IPT/TIG domain-containing protein n=1 Tax=Prauserella cavernicola TaxID=2800127 RepID=A0A934QTP6_9PSEU|nr:hypothetical protein [Prauserella cavernicola]
MLLGAACAPLTGTASAQAATVTVSPGTADPDYATVVELRGSGFQSVQGGHGGVYVLFGWVSDAGGGWRPSQGGSAGSTYKYVQDSEARDNNGFQRYLAFPGSDTGGSANGVVAADGTWQARLVIPGARFPAVDRSGNTTQVDCTQVRCGVITIGAHGVVNPANETFTPVDFAVPGQDAAPPPASPQPPPATTTTAPKPEPAVTTEATDARAGDDVEVTGTGFAPGENVAVTLHSDPAELPPVRAGENGGFTYTATIPDDVAEGTHRLVFTGEQSTVETSVELTVLAAATSSAAPPTSRAEPAVRAQGDGEKGDALFVALLVGGAVLLVVAAVAVVVRLRRRTGEIEGN